MKQLFREFGCWQVENLKAVGEQLVSDLVATASEVFEEFDASYAKTPFDSAEVLFTVYIAALPI